MRVVICHAVCRFLSAWLLVGLSPGARAEEITLNPVADTTLASAVPDHSSGGQTFFNAGITQNLTTNRALMRFELRDQIPAGSIIRAADLFLEVTRQPKDGYSPANFELHRLLKSWGEGDKIAADSRSPGLGSIASTNEATWNARFAFSTNSWTIPGGAAGADFVASASSAQAVFDVGSSPYQFSSTPQMIADLQLWLNHPEANFGWLLKESEEITPFTARRFGSREDPNVAPRLVIEFTPPFHIDHAEKAGDSFSLSFAALAGKNYAVFFRDSLVSGAWSTLTNFTIVASTNVTVTNSTTALQRFYRVGEQ